MAEKRTVVVTLTQASIAGPVTITTQYRLDGKVVVQRKHRIRNAAGREVDLPMAAEIDLAACDCTEQQLRQLSLF